MRRFLLPLVVATFGLAVSPIADAADAKAELQELVTKVQAKLRSGQRTEKELTQGLAAFDTLLAAHAGEKTDDVAHILVMKAMLYAQVLDNNPKAIELLQKVKADYPETEAGKRVPDLIAGINKQADAKKIQAALKVGAPMPGFEEKDLEGKPLNLARFKGKVLLVDFWATWCGPCVAELPNLQTAYGKYHGKGFEIVGISLDRDKEKLTSFLTEKKITWPQCFVGEEGKIAEQFGIESIPSTFLVDGQGKIIARDLRGEQLEAALAKALP